MSNNLAVDPLDCGSFDCIGKSNGNGPWHLITADRTGTLCGRKKFHICTPHNGLAPADICTHCMRKKRTAYKLRDQRAVNENAATTQAAHSVHQLELTRTEIPKLRRQLLAAITDLHKASSDHLDKYLSLAYGTGYFTLHELGDAMGVTRERVRQRIAPGK